MAAACAHIELVETVRLPNQHVCEECVKIHSRWVHLRTCQTCGVTLCCDSSPNRHASRHAAEVGHPVARSAEPGEDWSWCYVDEVAFVVRAQDA
jgi:hypothetical protein